ncbi:Ig-like domain-containing protein [Lentimicrobium sp. S6]|uniref:Ig-like domain-containing protein n=1 Tax=Lentimicrobium sp. S6 TaxID=2735872 RepID=UPI001556F192|nr:Ig-like domain-containing protein [Lentimicrobium sp. S6]NPD46041.1 Ig-like domain-containing protein [Lentimicrobium sp. S6]
MRFLKKYQLLVFLLLAMSLQYCASPGPLGGGPKDEEPPVFLGSDPVKYSRNTRPRKIQLQFDEFLVLKDLQQNLIISPPLNEDPDIKLKGKKVVIKNDKDLILAENTTYTYYFGDAICDLHEDNPIENFEYVFSTGPSLDSLSIRGKILQSEYLTPEESVYVCLYKKGMNDTIPFDSLPYFVRPYYVSRTNELGEYKLNNLRLDDYLMFAIKDVNSNYYFDMPNEEISFLDSLIFPEDVFDFIPDSIPINLNDTALMDSIWEYHSYSMVQNPVDLYLFTQHDSIPRLAETAVELNQKIDFFFKFPIQDSIHFNLFNDSTDESWYIEEFSKYRDTLTLWLPDLKYDTLFLSMQVDTLAIDTMDFVVRTAKKEVDKPKRRRKKKEDKSTKKKEDKKVLKFSNNVKKPFPFYKSVLLEFETPLAYANLKNLVALEDTMEINVEAYFLDSLKRKLRIEYPWKEETNYKISIPQEALVDIFGLENDSINLSMTTSTIDDYSNINVSIQVDSNCVSPVVITLVKGEADKEIVIQKHVIYGDSLLVLPYVVEGDYYLKALEDFNGNGRWNTGNYGLNLLSEPVYYFPLPLSAKSGWNIEETWKITIKDRKRPEVIKKEKKEKK